MRKNNKGFVLVESIVAAVFVLGLSTFLILNLVPLISVYEETFNFDTADSKYDAHLVRKMLLMDESCKVEKILSFGTQKYHYFQDKDICAFLSHSNYCNMLLSDDYLNVKEIILTTYSATPLKQISESDLESFSRPLQDYIKYMPTYGSNNLSFYKYANRIVLVFGDGTVTNIEILKNYSNDTNQCG